MRGDARLSIREVASAAAVSVATVSRVLNETGPVREDTRFRVLEVIARLGYVPHAAARSLITRQTRTLGVVLPDVYGEFFSELIRGADTTARGRGYHLLISGAHSDLDETREVLRTLHGRVDGLALMAPAADDEALEGSLPPQLPVILLNSTGRSGRYGSLCVDNHGGMRAMTHHLVRLGHRRIAFIQGPAGNQDAADRLRGYRDGLSAAHIARDAALELPGDFSEELGHQAAARLAVMAPRPTAVVAANDAMAIGCLSGLREHGLRVPADIALAGFDDIPIARFVTPALSTVRVSIAEFGNRAIERLVDSLEGGAPLANWQEVLPTTLVIRNSCGARARGAPVRPQTARTANHAAERRRNRR
jgi:LacI family transcriptional regulator